jgi:Protein of unknown function (DUF3489)
MLSKHEENIMAKLTDTQRIVLSAAAARDDGSATVPAKMNGAAASKVGASLVMRRLMREVRTKAGTPVWRHDEDGPAISLIITRAGRDAIGVEEDALPKTKGPSNAPARETQATVGKKRRKSSSNEKDALDASAKSPRAGTKQALVTTMLWAEGGATLDALVNATGWLPHTTRAALTGLRKRGFMIERTREQGSVAIYRIVSAPAAGAA